MKNCIICNEAGEEPVHLYGKVKPKADVYLCRQHAVLLFQKGESWILPLIMDKVCMKFSPKVENKYDIFSKSK